MLILNTGTLVGITNSLASIPGFVGPAVVGVITNNNVSTFSRSTSTSSYVCVYICSKQLKPGVSYSIYRQASVLLAVFAIVFCLTARNNHGIGSIISKIILK